MSNLWLSIILVFSLPLLAMRNNEISILTRKLSLKKAALKVVASGVNEKFENCLEHYEGDVDKSLNNIKTEVFDRISVDLHGSLKEVYCSDNYSTNKISYYSSQYRDFDYYYQNNIPLNSSEEIVVLEDCTFEQALLKYAFNKAKKARGEKRHELQEKVLGSKVFEVLDIQIKNVLGRCVWPSKSFS